ncbi:MAG TPA: hypothetical protein VKZ53_19765 [Candidatus Angelobacter sp.]|nr:hypothetical protein [Candidatus Angelobacter sp.]
MNHQLHGFVDNHLLDFVLTAATGKCCGAPWKILVVAVLTSNSEIVSNYPKNAGADFFCAKISKKKFIAGSAELPLLNKT